MAITQFLTISQLKEGSRLTQMNVRVVHKWKRPEIKNKTKTEAIELLLLDAENEIVQATIRKPLISKLNSTMNVGKVYNIRNLTVTNNPGFDRATPNPIRLQFEFSSRVYETTDTSIPLHGYRFTKFDEINNGRVPTTHYIDVVGKLFEIGPITETRNGHKCRTIKLEDIEGNKLCCTLWEPHAFELPALISRQPNPEQSKVIILQCVETRKFEAKWRVQTTFNATVYHLNPDIPEVNEFEPSLSTPAPSNSLQIIDLPDDNGVQDFLTSDNVKSISDIILNDTAGTYYTLAKIIDLDCTAGWYYDSCRGCKTKTSINDQGRWFCSREGCVGNKIGYSTRIPRFQLKFLVSDPSNDEAHFVAFDGLITPFITPTAAELISKLEKANNEDSIPDELEIFIDKQFVFKIEIDEKFNVAQGSHSYTILSMTDDSDMAVKWHAKYTQKFKEECESFKSSTKKLMARVENAKVVNGCKERDVQEGTHVNIEGNNVKLHQDEASETADTSPNITPMKRAYTNRVAEQMQAEYDVGDASSATKKVVVMKNN